MESGGNLGVELTRGQQGTRSRGWDLATRLGKKDPYAEGCKRGTRNSDPEEEVP